MKKTYKIDVDCANCANKMEEAAKNTAGVKDATVNFMMLKMIVEFEDGQDPKAVMKDVLAKQKTTAKSIFNSGTISVDNIFTGIVVNQQRGTAAQRYIRRLWLSTDIYSGGGPVL